MTDGTDWLMAPVLAGVCQYVWLIDGSIGLADVARMNEAMLVRAENERRAQAAANEARGEM